MNTGSKIAIGMGLFFMLCVICVVVGILLYSIQKPTTPVTIDETVYINEDEGEEEDESVEGNEELPAVENEITFINDEAETNEDVFVGDELGDDLLLDESV